MQLLLAQPAPQEVSPWLWLAAAALAALVLLVLLSPRLRRSGPVAPTAQQPNPAQQHSTERNMQNLAHEVSELVRKAIAQLDSRSARLETLIKQADERIARLASAGEAGNHNGANPPAQHTAHATTDPDEVDPRYVEIYTLQDQGLTPAQIADQLNRPLGEVELILALRPRRSAAV